MRPEGKSAADNQMEAKGPGDMTDEDESGIPDKVGAEPDTKNYTNAANVGTVPIGKSRGTGLQVNNGALDATDAAGSSGNASAIAKVSSVTGEKVPGMNYGPSIGRMDDPPAAIKSTGTEDSVESARSAVERRWPGIDTEHVDAGECERTWR